MPCVKHEARNIQARRAWVFRSSGFGIPPPKVVGSHATTQELPRTSSMPRSWPRLREYCLRSGSFQCS